MENIEFDDTTFSGKCAGQEDGEFDGRRFQVSVYQEDGEFDGRSFQVSVNLMEEVFRRMDKRFSDECPDV